jgi:holo-ACP synthase
LINKILEDREDRYNEILKLLEEYNLPVICGKLNYPGEHKNTHEADRGFSILSKLIIENFGEAFIYSTYLEGYDGKSILGVLNMDAHKAKQIGIEIEEKHLLGRIFDIDIYTKDGSSLGREKISKTERKCIICGGNARICIKTGKHILDEVLLEIHKLIYYVS